MSAVASVFDPKINWDISPISELVWEKNTKEANGDFMSPKANGVLLRKVRFKVLHIS